MTENTSLFPDGIESLAALGGGIPTSHTSAEVEEAANLQPITVQEYASSDRIQITAERYPAILRTDTPYTLSLHPDDVEVFTRLRNNIGVDIYLHRWSEKMYIRKSDIPGLNDRLINILDGHDIKISDSGNDWQIGWGK